MNTKMLMHVEKITDHLYQQHFARPEYTFCSSVDRNSAFHEHHCFSFLLMLFHFPGSKKGIKNLPFAYLDVQKHQRFSNNRYMKLETLSVWSSIS